VPISFWILPGKYVTGLCWFSRNINYQLKYFHGSNGDAKMNEPIHVKSSDPLLGTLKFKPYRNTLKRHVVRFMPASDEPQTREIITPWGGKLTASKGDFLVSELDKPEDAWPVQAEIFDQTYMIIAPDLCIKRAITMLAPLEDMVNGDADQLVCVHSLEGVETVRAGDFFLARGVKGEIWAYPREKAEENLRPAE
jgi:hypothetical protein